MNILDTKRVRFVLSLLASFPGILFVYAPLLIGVTVVGVVVPFATGGLIDALAYRRSPWGPFVFLAVLLLVKAVLAPLLQRFICSRSRKLETDLQLRILDAAMDFSPSRLAAFANGELVAKMTRDAYAVGGFVRGLFPRLLQAVVVMFASGCALFARSPVLAVSFMAFFPVSVLLFAPFARRFSTNSHRVRSRGDASFNALFDFLNALPLLRTLDAERRFADAPRTAFEQLKQGNDETDSLSVRFGFCLGMLLVAGEIVVLGVAGTLAAKGRIPVGDVVVYQMLFIAAIQAVQGVVSLLPEFANLREGADSICETTSAPTPRVRCARIGSIKKLSFSHVTFAYPAVSARPVVDDFSAEFSAGTVVGFTGANGAGKSTLLKLAVGALEPQRGMVYVNGHPLGKIDLGEFRRRIGVVFQDNVIVAGTVRDNITLRDPGFSREDVDRALALSGFDSVVARLPNGLDTLLGNQTRMLSGGERQRLAIARALVRDPDVLVFDEATNHLDAESRKEFSALLARLRRDRIILLAGHDTTFSFADSFCLS